MTTLRRQLCALLNELGPDDLTTAEMRAMVDAMNTARDRKRAAEARKVVHLTLVGAGSAGRTQ